MSEADNTIEEALWKKVCEDFDDDAAHRGYVTHCQRADLLAVAAGRYREHKDQLESESQYAQADKRLAAIASLAVASLDAKRTTPAAPKASKVLTIIVTVLTLAAAVGLVKALML